MSARALVIWRTLWQWGVKQLADRWIEPWPLPRAAMRELAVPLLPSPLVRHVTRAFLLAQALFSLELAWLGHALASGAVFAAALAGGWFSRRGRGQRGRQLRRLMLSADARLHGLTVNGEVMRLQVHPSSLTVGRWLLLRVVGEGRGQLLVLGPDNVEASVLAELRRRMAFPALSDFG